MRSDYRHISIVCNDRPGLLADIARVLREQRLRVHDARIATFGERAEDMFQISDEHRADIMAGKLVHPVFGTIAADDSCVAFPRTFPQFPVMTGTVI